MRYFTGNPLERMMMRPPIVRAKRDPAPPVPKRHPCYGCKRRNESGCTLPCYRGVDSLPSR